VAHLPLEILTPKDVKPSLKKTMKRRLIAGLLFKKTTMISTGPAEQSTRIWTANERTSQRYLQKSYRRSAHKEGLEMKKFHPPVTTMLTFPPAMIPLR
jgi:hypothetical protein